MIAVVLLLLVGTAVALIVLSRRVTEPESDADVILRAALKLYSIQSRLRASRTRRDIRRDSDAIRQHLMAELDAMSPNDDGELDD